MDSMSASPKHAPGAWVAATAMIAMSVLMPMASGDGFGDASTLNGKGGRQAEASSGYQGENWPEQAQEVIAFLGKHHPDHLQALRENGSEHLARFITGDFDYMRQAISQMPAIQNQQGVMDGLGIQHPLSAFEPFGDIVDADTAAPPREAAEDRPAPSQLYRDYHPACDLDGDGQDDFFVNDFSPRDARLVPRPFSFTGYSEVRGISGADGSQTWYHDNGEYTPVIIPPWTEAFSNGAYVASPDATPPPKWPAVPIERQVMPAADVNNDGVCDMLTFGFQVEFPITPFSIFLGVTWIEFNGALKMLDGASGEIIWSKPINASTFSLLLLPPLAPGGNLAEQYETTGYPTGWDYFETRSGPKFVWKTTDIRYTWSSTTGSLRITDEHIVLGDATDGTEYWTRNVMPQPSTAGQERMLYMGHANLAGDSEHELIFDIFSVDGQEGTPGCCTTFAVKGELEETGEDLWTPAQRRYYRDPGLIDGLSREVGPPGVIQQHVFLVGDITGDGYDDLVPVYLGVRNLEASGIGHQDEDFRTHLFLCRGAAENSFGRITTSSIKDGGLHQPSPTGMAAISLL